jgi:N-acetylmuramoyl-L-alanine amidase
MLQIIGIYLLKSLIVSAVLLFYYWLALRNKRFHYYNRFYLLSAVILSIVLPLLNLNLFTLFSNNDKAIQMFNVMYASGENEISFAGNTASLNWQQLLFVLVLVVTLILLLRLMFRIITIYSIKKKYPVRNMQEFDFINTDLQQAPFSFLKNIFWRNDISIEERTGRLILQHELAHIKEKHTLDKLFMQIIVAILWINPLYRLYQKELYLIHEFIADDKSVTDNDTTAFAEMLLHAHYGKFNFDPAQPFFYSPIKRRLLMLTTSKESKFSYLRRIMALPLIALTVLLFAFRLQKENVSENITTLKPGTTFTLVLDAGHGGEDGGAIAADGTKEKDVSLAISKKIKSLSSEYGIDVIMTRNDDVFMNPRQKADFSNKQKADAFVSIHANAAEQDQLSKSGMEVVISKNNDNKQLDKSKILGSALIQNLNKNLLLPRRYCNIKLAFGFCRQLQYLQLLLNAVI